MVVLVDHFSKFMWVYLTEDKTALTILDCIKDVIDVKLHGRNPPQYLNTDNGPEFISDILK